MSAGAELPGTHEDALCEVVRLREENLLLRQRLSEIGCDRCRGDGEVPCMSVHDCDHDDGEVDCPDCAGTGRKSYTPKCNTCSSTMLQIQVLCRHCVLKSAQQLHPPYRVALDKALREVERLKAENAVAKEAMVDGPAWSQAGNGTGGTTPEGRGEPDVCYRQIGFFSCLLPAGHDATAACPGATPRETIAKDEPQVADSVAAYGHGGFDKQNEGW